MHKLVQFLDDLKLYALIFGIKVSRFVPRFVLNAFMEAIVPFWFVLDSYRRNAVLNNLKRILGRNDKLLAYMTFRNYMLNFTDTLKVKHTSCEKLLSMVEIENLNLLERTMEKYTKALMLTAHIGNWEMGASVPGCLGYRCFAIVEHIDDRWLEVLNDIRRHVNATIYTSENFMKAFRKLSREGGLLITAMDRYISGEFVVRRFFNGFRKFPIGIFKLNERLKLPIIFAYVVRKNTRGYLGVVQDIYEGPYQAENMLDFYIANLERAVSRFPTQWFSFDYNWMD